MIDTVADRAVAALVAPRKIAALMMGERPSCLATDAYKIAMAQAGFPLRTETFYLTYRHGGPLYVPFDLGATCAEVLWSGLRCNKDLFPSDWTGAMRAAAMASRHVEFWSAPAGSVVHPSEPLLTATGPSFAVSWLEPWAIMLHFPLQVATALRAGRREFACTCNDEAGIVAAVARAMGVDGVRCEIREESYTRAVQDRVDTIASVLRPLSRSGLSQAFEVGLRSATCMQMHMAAAKACKQAGMTRTSNVAAAAYLDMTPIGTMGHEHPQRWLSDIAAFRAMRDMRGEPPVYLTDTYDAMDSGIPAAFQAAKERDVRGWALRLDSNDQVEQLRRCVEIERTRECSPPVYVFEDGYDAERTAQMQRTATDLGISDDRRQYGYGGYIVIAAPWIDLHRNRVAAVWKLSQTGTDPVMKATVGKQSLPGVPRIFRRLRGVSSPFDVDHSLFGQAGEEPPDGFAVLDPTDARQVASGCGDDPATPVRIGRSPQTAALVQTCYARMGARRRVGLERRRD